MDSFGLEAVEKRLHMRIVRALVGPIHAGLNSVPAQLILDQVRPVFDASVRVEDQARSGRPHSPCVT